MPSDWGRRKGLKGYDKFRTGLTFRDIRSMLWSYSEDSADWPDVSRGTVLGFWHALKLDMYNAARAQESSRQRKKGKSHVPF